MKLKLKLIFASAMVGTLIANAQNSESKYYDNLPFKMEVIKAPEFKTKDYNIKEFGAVGDGTTLNTEAFQKAINKCSENGSGRVIVQSGIWLTGPIVFKSNVNLHLMQGAHIQFSRNFDLYPLIDGYFEGITQVRCQSPLSGFNLENISISGDGIIDGAGDAWRPVKKSKMTDGQWKELNKTGVLNASGNTWWPSKQALEAENVMSEMLKNKSKLTKDDFAKVRDYLRPVMVNFIKCKNVVLEGVTFQNSPAWNLNPIMCENIILRNLNIRNSWYSQNGDGLDLESCKNALIYNCRFDVGDDALCMKSGKDKEGRDRGVPTENVIIADCIVYHGHGGFVIGSEMSGGMRNLKVSNCNFIGTDIGLRFKTARGRGGVVENIYVNDIYMKDIPNEALSFNMYYEAVDPSAAKSAEQSSINTAKFTVDEGTPIFRNFYLNNIYCVGAKTAVVIQGLPEMSIKNIEINNLNMTAEKGIMIFDAENIKLSNVKVDVPSPVINVSQSKNVILDNIVNLKSVDTYLKLSGDKTTEINIKNIKPEYKSKINIGKEVNQKALKIEN